MGSESGRVSKWVDGDIGWFMGGEAPGEDIYILLIY